MFELLLDRKRKLPGVISDYQEENIFNVDENDFFYRLPNKCMILKNEKNIGSNKTKEIITILFFCCVKGEKFKPLIIYR